jgi:DNA polymerase-3 subunit delta
VYLLVGEPFQTEAVARQLIDVLVPKARRSLNLELYDGRTTDIGSVLDSMRMPGLFSGTKVLWIREPTFLLSADKRSDVTDALFAAWGEERQSLAAEKLLVLAALAGWTQEQFVAMKWATSSASALSSLFGRSLEDGERQSLPAIAAFCEERHLTVAAHRDDSGLLEQFVSAGVPPDSILILSSTAVDRRKRIFKTLQEVGSVLELTIARERSGALSAESVEQLVGQKLAEHGKQVSSGARRLIMQRAGTDPALLAIEMEKLCLYAGDKQSISEGDVADSMRDLAESWIFDFTRALAQRQAATAVPLLRQLFQQGEHPLRILVLIARELRILLLARECVSTTLAGSWNTRTPFTVFRDRLLPTLDDRQREAFAGVHPYAIYQALQNASRTKTQALQRALLGLQQLDVKLKSSAGDSRLLLEAFVLDMCRGA